MINLLGLSGLDRSDFGAESLGLERFVEIRASADYSFTRNLEGDITAGYRYSDVIDEDRQDNRYRGGIGLNFLPWRWMTLRLSYDFNKFDSQGSEDYVENRAMFQITLQPHQPWRY